jgi:predicted Holliday junction resolvase-like endonuclease
MDFNLAFEIILGFLIMVILVFVITTMRNTVSLKEEISIKQRLIKFKLQKTIQRKQKLDEKIVLAEEINLAINTRVSVVIKKLLLFTKSIFDKSL